MVVVILRFKVQDYARWLKVFVARDPLRRQAGCLGRRVLQSARDPNQIAVILEWDTRANYDAFAATGRVQTPEGRACAGIIGEPEVLSFIEAEGIPAWEG